MGFKSVFVGFHMVRLRVSYRSPRMGNGAPSMHGRSVQIMQRFVEVLAIVFLERFVMTVQRTFHLLLCLREAHAAIGGFTDSR